MRKETRRGSVLPATAVTAAAAVLLLAGCSGSVQVSPPRTGGTASAQCAALQKLLPSTLMGQQRRSTSPASANTAAWGNPAITLRCGVPVPDVLDPKSADYDPSAVSTVANGMCWITTTGSGGGYRFTTVKQQTYVEVNVPGAYAGQDYPLPSLVTAITRSDPADPNRVFDCL